MKNKSEDGPDKEGKQKKSLSMQLEEAGLLKPSQKTRFILIAVTLACCGFFFSAINLVSVIENNQLSSLFPLFKAFIPLILGFYLPRILLSMKRNKYRRKLLSEFTDVMTLLLIFLRYGLTMHQTMNQMIHLLKSYRYAFADQFERTLFELNALPVREQAWKNFADRCGFPEILYLTDFMRHENAYDRSLLESLERSRDFIQKKRFSVVEEMAKKVSIYLAIPLILFMIPALLLVLTGPTIVQSVQRLSGWG